MKVSGFERGIRLALAALTFAITVLGFANVLARNLFSAPLAWADEVMVYLMVWGVFLGAIVVTLRREHLNMDILYLSVRPSIQRWLTIAGAVGLAVVLGIVAWSSIQFLLTMWRLGNRSVAANIPMVIPHGALTLGSIAMALVATWLAIKHAFSADAPTDTVADGESR